MLPENQRIDPAGALITRILELKQENPLLLDGQPPITDEELAEIDRQWPRRA